MQATDTAIRGRVLCVDDEPAVLRSLRWLLQKQFEVEVASSGAEGLERVRATRYDVVISDQRMPGMMGSEFLREVRRVSPYSMRILLTGYSDLQAMVRSVNDGEVFRFVTKPWRFEELLRTVGEAVKIARAQTDDGALPEPTASTAIDLEGESILVIDDDPEVLTLIRASIGETPPLRHAGDLGEAAAAFDLHRIGLVISNMRVGGVDASRLLKQLKRRHPAIVAVVYTDIDDAVDVMGLINQAQVHRVLPRPMKPTMLRIALASATLKRRQLRASPVLPLRHVVERLDDDTRRSLTLDIQRANQGRRAAPAAVGAGLLLQRMGLQLRRLFGA